MGDRGPGAYKRHLNHCTPEYAEMLYGPSEMTNEKIKTVRRYWRDGGREIIMRNWKVPGVRPFGFWYCDVPVSDRRRAMKECATEAEMVLLLNLADEAERKAIAAGDIIAKQRAGH
jgi:hypothetical protein